MTAMRAKNKNTLSTAPDCFNVSMISSVVTAISSTKEKASTKRSTLMRRRKAF